ncbi:RNA polymerase sigma factor [Myxococcota bacterium]|nr:RNA polymerase sigma factor [Myxococcota bacterium]
MGGPRPRALTPLETLLCESIDVLRSSAMRWTRDPADADDLVQEVLLRLLTLAPRLDLTRNVPAYLRRTLANLYINQWRRMTWIQRLARSPEEGWWQGTSGPDAPHPGEDPALAVQRIRLGERLARALEALPRPFLEVLVRVDLLGWDYQETARDLGLPVGTVMSRLFRARRRMRMLLDEPEGPVERPDPPGR